MLNKNVNIIFGGIKDLEILYFNNVIESIFIIEFSQDKINSLYFISNPNNKTPFPQLLATPISDINQDNINTYILTKMIVKIMKQI